MFANDFLSTLLIALIVSVIAPIMLSIITSRQRMGQDRILADQREDDRAEDFKRQDAVAARTEQVARLAAASDARMARATQETHNQLQVIHGLVNSSLTEALKAQLVALQAQLVSAEDVVQRKEAVGEPLGTSELAKLDVVRNDIAELEAVLRDRHVAQTFADKQIAKDPEAGKVAKDPTKPVPETNDKQKAPDPVT